MRQPQDRITRPDQRINEPRPQTQSPDDGQPKPRDWITKPDDRMDKPSDQLARRCVRKPRIFSCLSKDGEVAEQRNDNPTIAQPFMAGCVKGLESQSDVMEISQLRSGWQCVR